MSPKSGPGCAPVVVEHLLRAMPDDAAEEIVATCRPNMQVIGEAASLALRCWGAAGPSGTSMAPSPLRPCRQAYEDGGDAVNQTGRKACLRCPAGGPRSWIAGGAVRRRSGRRSGLPVLGADHGYQLSGAAAVHSRPLPVHGSLPAWGWYRPGLIGLVDSDTAFVSAVGCGRLVVANIGTTCAIRWDRRRLRTFGSVVRQRARSGDDRSPFVLRGSFHGVEHCCHLVDLFLAYIASGVLAPPDWGAAAHGLLVRPCLPTAAAIAIVTATVGTTLAPWGLSFIHSYAVDESFGPTISRSSGST